MTKATRLFAVSLAILVAIAGVAASPSAQTRVEVSAVGSEITEQGSIATAKFKIQVTNHEETAITAVRAVFEGGIEVAIGDVAADATVTSAAQKFLFNTADLMATKNVPVHITVNFTVDGTEQSMPALLVLRRAE